MKITIKLAQIKIVSEVINKLATQEMNFQAARAISKLNKELEVDFTLIREKTNLLIEKYADKSVQPLSMQPTDPNFEAFNNEYSVLMLTEVELEYTPIKLEFFNELKITPLEVTALYDFIEETSA